MENKMTDAEKEKFLADHQEMLDDLVHVALDHFPRREEQRKLLAEKFLERTGLPSSVMDRIEIATLVIQVGRLTDTVEKLEGLLVKAAEDGNRLMEMISRAGDITNVPLRGDQAKKTGSN